MEVSTVSACHNALALVRFNGAAGVHLWLLLFRHRVRYVWSGDVSSFFALVQPDLGHGALSSNLRITVAIPYRQEPQQQTCSDEGFPAGDLLSGLPSFGGGDGRKLHGGAEATNGPNDDGDDGPLMEMVQHVVCKGTAVQQTASESNQTHVRHAPRAVRSFVGGFLRRK